MSSYLATGSSSRNHHILYGGALGCVCVCVLGNKYLFAQSCHQGSTQIHQILGMIVIDCIRYSALQSIGGA